MRNKTERVNWGDYEREKKEEKQGFLRLRRIASGWGWRTSPDFSPALSSLVFSPAFSLAFSTPFSPGLSPAISPAISPAFSPDFSPALSPAFFQLYFRLFLQLFSRAEATLYEGVVGWMVGWMVGRSVTSYFFGLLGATNAVYTALFFFKTGIQKWKMSLWSEPYQHANRIIFTFNGVSYMIKNAITADMLIVCSWMFERAFISIMRFEQVELLTR